MVFTSAGILFRLYNCSENQTCKGTDIGERMLVILNEKSGGGTAIKKWERVRNRLNLNNGSTEIFYADKNGTESNFILDALNKGKTEFVIAGGDGTMNHFLNCLISSAEPEIIKEIKIGAVGIGSSNDFHKPFRSKNIIDKIPYKLNFKGAIHHDVGCIIFEKNGNLFKKYFLINASLGVTAEANNFFNNPDFILKYLKRIKTKSAILYTAVNGILKYKNFPAQIETNGELFRTEISNLGIIKCPFFSGSLRYQSKPLINNGLFDVHLYQSLNKPELLSLLYKLSYGFSDNSLNKKFWRTGRIKISSENEFVVEFDGEVITTNSAGFSVIPELIKVCIN